MTMKKRQHEETYANISDMRLDIGVHDCIQSDNMPAELSGDISPLPLHKILITLF